MNDLNQAIREHRVTLNAIANRLGGLAESLDAVGMTKLADELFNVADALPDLAKALNDAYSEDLTGHLQNAQEHTALLMKAALAGVFKPAQAEAAS